MGAYAPGQGGGRSNAIDFTGKEFGCVKVVKRIGSNHHGAALMVGFSRDSFELELAVQAIKVGEKGDVMLTPKYPGV